MNLQMSVPQMVAVVFTGMFVVFFAIALLILIIWLMGKMFTNMNNNKKNEVVSAKPVSPVPVKTAPVSKEEPVKALTNTDDDEIIAVISSAVAMMSLVDGKNYRVKSVKAIKGNNVGRPAWSMAGLRENTRPFRQR